MKKNGGLAIVLLCSFMLCNCAAALVGGLIWKSSKSKEEKRKFMEDLRHVNLEREKEGLSPLNECIEIYHFDPGWALERKDCKRTVDSLKAAGVKPDSTKVIKVP